MIHGLQYERERSRPSEGEGQDQFSALGIGKGEAATAEDGTGGVPEGTRTRRSHVALILLQAHAEKGAARRGAFGGRQLSH